MNKLRIAELQLEIAKAWVEKGRQLRLLEEMNKYLIKKNE